MKSLSFFFALMVLTSLAKANTPVDICSVSASSDDGNVAENTIDGDPDTRWSAYGTLQWVQFDLCEAYDLNQMDIAWYKGDERQALFRIEVSEDGNDWDRVFTGYSSGESADFETFDIESQNTNFVRIMGFTNTVNLWNSVSEVAIYGEPDPSEYMLNAVTDLVITDYTATTATLSWTDNSTNEDGYLIQIVSQYSGNYIDIAVTTDTTYTRRELARGGLHQFRVLPYKGDNIGDGAEVAITFNYFSDPIMPISAQASSDDGNIAAGAIDGIASTRWSAKGDGEYIVLDLGNEYVIDTVSIAWYKGDQRQQRFELACSQDNIAYFHHEDYEGSISSGTTDGYEEYPVECDENQNIRYLKITGYGNTANTWNSITDIQLTGAMTKAID